MNAATPLGARGRSVIGGGRPDQTVAPQAARMGQQRVPSPHVLGFIPSPHGLGAHRVPCATLVRLVELLR